ncbi:MAG: DUF6559 family protein [Candidatus Sedimenticola sp. (ex Thyasira tokunagai)]
MNILNEFLKKRIISKYIFEMAPVLVKGFGPQDQFTVPQIETAARKCDISMQYIPYAIALYRHEESNRTVKLYHINQAFLELLRSEISEWFFEGYDYRSKDVIKLAKPRVWRGGHIRSMANRFGRTATY